MYTKLFSSILGLLSAFLFFYTISFLVSEDDKIEIQKSKTTQFDFIRHKDESELENKKRIRPKKPETKKAPSSPKLNIAKADMTKPNIVPVNIDLPKVNLSTIVNGDLLSGANVGNGTMEVIPLVRIAPVYPQKALRMRKEGFVKMRFTIDPDGRVHDIKVLESEPGRFFDNSAVNAIKKWKFKPKIVNGKSVTQIGEQTITFSLGNS